MNHFLDANGVSYLYRRLSLQDYPNNETLIAILNAIDETKLDKSIFEEYVGTEVSSVEPANNDIPRVYIDGDIPTTKAEVLATLKYKSKTDIFTAYIKIKCQGNSSLNYPKKNFTIKMFEDEARTIKLKKNFKGWGAQNKFCLKANWMDFSHARNICCAKLWGEVVRSRDDYQNYPEEFKTSPNQGAVDGFPFLLYCNGHYWGRYTWNIPKDGWMFNMDSNLDTHCILCSEDYNSSCFRAAAVINGTDWTDELHDTVPASIVTRWNEIITFVQTSSDDDFKANLSNYFYVDSLIDYYIFSYMICHLDGLGKNQLFFTYDGQRWIAGAYDMDSTIGLYWNGESFVSITYRMQEDYEVAVHNTSNLLYDRLKTLYSEEITARWEVLKTTILDKYHMIEVFDDFCGIVSNEIMNYDYHTNTGGGAFTKIPSTANNNISQIREYIVNRYNYVNMQLTTGTDGIETILRQDYSPQGEAWTDLATVNLANGDYIEISVDISNCTSNTENIISIGTDITKWLQIGYHVYYTAGNKTMQFNTIDGKGYKRSNIKITNDINVIRVDGTGISLNGKTILAFSLLNTANSVQVGSQEGTTRSNATYNYIKVVNI